MKYIVLSNTTEFLKRARFFSSLRLFLSVLEFDYPFFTNWLDKVFVELNTPNRKIILCVSDDEVHIYGVAILKDSVDEKKICTIRVERVYQRLGIGTRFVRMAQDILDCEKPLITVSEKMISDFRPFLKKFDFELCSKVKSLYLNGQYEYFFNKEYLHKNILLSIKPKYADAIFSGDKKIEFRKKIASSSVGRVFVYSSFPCKRIIGYFDIERILYCPPIVLWNKYKNIGCISYDEFFGYFTGVSFGYGILISNFYKYKNGFELYEILENNKAPQNFIYVDNVQILKKLLDREILSR